VVIASRWPVSDSHGNQRGNQIEDIMRENIKDHREKTRWMVEKRGGSPT
jgi:hypothetical protein